MLEVIGISYLTFVANISVNSSPNWEQLNQLDNASNYPQIVEIERKYALEKLIEPRGFEQKIYLSDRDDERRRLEERIFGTDDRDRNRRDSRDRREEVLRDREQQRRELRERLEHNDRNDNRYNNRNDNRDRRRDRRELEERIFGR
jgi:hypothetical protein